MRQLITEQVGAGQQDHSASNRECVPDLNCVQPCSQPPADQQWIADGVHSAYPTTEGARIEPLGHTHEVKIVPVADGSDMPHVSHREVDEGQWDQAR